MLLCCAVSCSGCVLCSLFFCFCDEKTWEGGVESSLSHEKSWEGGVDNYFSGKEIKRKRKKVPLLQPLLRQKVIGQS